MLALERTVNQHIACKGHSMLVGVDCGYGPGKETVFRSGGLCFDRSVGMPDGNRINGVSWMGGVL